MKRISYKYNPIVIYCYLVPFLYPHQGKNQQNRPSNVGMPWLRPRAIMSGIFILFGRYNLSDIILRNNDVIIVFTIYNSPKTQKIKILSTFYTPMMHYYLHVGHEKDEIYITGCYTIPLF